MAVAETLYRFKIALSDVDRGVYETLDVRIVRHPSESARYFALRALAYCLSFEDGIAFSKGGLSSDEPALAVRAGGGRLLAWIDIGAPSAERLHRAAKAAASVRIFTASDLSHVRKEAQAGSIFHAEEIQIQTFDASFLDALASKFGRNTEFELVRNSAELYVTIDGGQLQSSVSVSTLTGESTTFTKPSRT